MNALHQLEQEGFRFKLTAEGKILCENTRPGKDLPLRLRPRLSELYICRDELTVILKKRQEWIEVLKEWEKEIAAGRDESAAESAWLPRLKDLAIAGHMSCAIGGKTWRGADVWERIMGLLLNGEGRPIDGGRWRTAVDAWQMRVKETEPATIEEYRELLGEILDLENLGRGRPGEISG